MSQSSDTVATLMCLVQFFGKSSMQFFSLSMFLSRFEALMVFLLLVHFLSDLVVWCYCQLCSEFGYMDLFLSNYRNMFAGVVAGLNSLNTLLSFSNFIDPCAFTQSGFCVWCRLQLVLVGCILFSIVHVQKMIDDLNVLIWCFYC